MIRKAALLGRELAHSISDKLHKELFPLLAPKFSLANDSIEYELIERPDADSFSSWISTAATSGYIGANITYPYKDDAYRCSQLHVGAAGAIKSGNVIRFNRGVPECGSTDGAGFVSALLREHPQFDLEQYHLILVGAGAAARAIAYTLFTKWMPMTLTIVNRNRSHAEALARFLSDEASGPTIRFMSINEAVRSMPERRHRMVVQATPMGQTNHRGNLLAGFEWDTSDLAADVIYNPLTTHFLQSAADASARTLNGLGMLVEQAALSQDFWFTGMLPVRSPLTDTEYMQVKKNLSNVLTKEYATVTDTHGR